MLHTLVVHVEDKPGVLNRVASLVARDNPHLYFDIQTLNDYGAASLQALRTATERIEQLVQSGDEAGFVELMAAGRRYLESRT